MAKKESERWMDWYRNKGGREKVNATRRARGWLTKKEFEELDSK